MDKIVKHYYCRRGDRRGQVRVWHEDMFGDMFDVMTVDEALAKHGAEIRFLFDNDDHNSDWDGITFLTKETLK